MGYSLQKADNLPPHSSVPPELGAAHWRRSDRRAYATGASRHPELVVLLGLSGRARYLLDGTMVRLTRGTLIFALAGQAHFLVSDTPDFDMWVFLIARKALPQGTGLPPLCLAERPAGLPARQIDTAHLAELDRLARQLAETSGAARRAGYQWWMSRAWSAWRASGDSRRSAVHPAVERAARFLRDDPDLAPDTLARNAGLSGERLAQVFRRQIGRSLTAFRNDIRLARVDRILAEDNRASLTRAALDAGFGSYSQFFRTFRGLRGQSPRDYYGMHETVEGPRDDPRSPPEQAY